MQYHGGKELISGGIASLILATKEERGSIFYFEPFLGGASVAARVARHFHRSFLSDLDPGIINFWSAVVSGWEPPENLSREKYEELRLLGLDDPLSTFAAHGCSFGGKKWGGYASNNKGRNYASQARNGALRKGRAITGADISCNSYEDIDPGPQSVVYCDPPYVSTTGYGSWDPEKFWATAEKWVTSGASVLVSEYEAPSGWKCLWEKEKHVGLGSGTRNSKKVGIEKVFTK